MDIFSNRGQHSAAIVYTAEVKRPKIDHCECNERATESGPVKVGQYKKRQHPGVGLALTTLQSGLEQLNCLTCLYLM